MTYIAGIDVGTTGVKAMILDTEGNVLGSGYVEYPSLYPHPGWVEQDAEQIIQSMYKACKTAVEGSGVDPKEIVSVGFSTQRSTFCMLDEDLKPIGNIFYSWQDGRSGYLLGEMAEIMDPEVKHQKCGMAHNPYDSLPKIYWIKKEMPEVYAKTKYIALMMDYILYRFGVDGIYTERCLGNCSQLIDPIAKTWSYDVIDAFGIDRDKLAPLVEPSTVLGEVTPEISELTGLAVGTKVVTGTGDQQCAAVGAGVIDDGAACLTLGTSGFLIIGSESADITKLPGIMFANNAGNTDLYELECLQMSAASSYRWLKDTLCTDEQKESAETGADPFVLMEKSVVKSAPGANGLIFLPFLQGNGYPHWMFNSKGVFAGIKFTTTREDVIRSVMEGITLESRDMYETVKEAGVEIKSLVMTGGAAKSPAWRQIVADLFDMDLRVLEVADAATVAAAILGAVGAGVFKDAREGVDKMIKFSETLHPIPENVEAYKKVYASYKQIIADVKGGAIFNALE
ncbi:MAG: hypothetical protein IJM62_02720 [Lachnospiraceae bacterium]|nr:hypothetical protein [Lachnospiraceae bacterium]